MATASSAQREPSMEEILASIRRIIEDSDTGQKQPEGAAAITQDVEPEPVSADVDAFRAELRTQPQQPRSVDLAATRPTASPVEQQVADTSTEQRPHISLAEVGAKLTSEDATDRPSSILASSGASADAVDTPEEVAAITTQPTLTAEQPWGSPANSVSVARAEVAAPVARLEATEIAASLEVEPVASVAEAPASRLAIVSEQTSRQVAAAFGELSEAFASRSKKTFDDKAEEMLKPMLQDWLDNNLPILVERLVREEIERVARGV